MSLYKRIGVFFLLLLLAYGLLIAAWPILGGAYSAGYRAVGNTVFRSFGPHASVRFAPFSEADKKMDTRVYLINRRTGIMKWMNQSIRLMGYVPTAEVIALILATPLPWSRKWKALLYGCILAQGLAALRVTVMILYGFSGTHPAALFTPGPFWSTVLSTAYAVVAVSFGFAFAAPILVWILATFRRGDVAVISQLKFQRAEEAQQPTKGWLGRSHSRSLGRRHGKDPCFPGSDDT